MNREILEKEFDPKFIKQRKGNFGNVLDYLETHTVIQRLNDAFDSNWSFEIVEYQQMGAEVVVLGKLTAEGIVKMQFGNSKVTNNSKTGEVVSIGDDLKAATSDCIKKASTLFGIGLHLYAEASDREDMSQMSGNKGDNLITKEQLAQIKQLRTQLKWTPEKVQEQAERLFATREITSLNTTMGNALVAYLQSQNDGGSEY
jgi:hypothetical protein